VLQRGTGKNSKLGDFAMKEMQYTEGKQATSNFEEGMRALFKVPKGAVVKAEKRNQKARASRLKKQKSSDKD